MSKINSITELRKWILKNYDPSEVGGNWGDTGNYDDSYEYGQQNGKTWTMYRVGTLIGLELELPEEVEAI